MFLTTTFTSYNKTFVWMFVSLFAFKKVNFCKKVIKLKTSMNKMIGNTFQNPIICSRNLFDKGLKKLNMHSTQKKDLKTKWITYIREIKFVVFARYFCLKYSRRAKMSIKKCNFQKNSQIFLIGNVISFATTTIIIWFVNFKLNLQHLTISH